MNCILTQKPTQNKTMNYPLSREGRVLINEVLEAHNARISDAFVEANSDKGMTEEALRKLSPKATKHYLLDLIDRKEPDAMETLASVIEPAKNATEETEE